MHAFSPKNPIFCTFLQGGGTTFWQAQKRGFSGPGGRAGAARAEGILFRNPLEVKVPPSPSEADVRSRASIATAILLSGRTNKHSELAERTESCR
jgi:hypothetical protein